MATDLRLKEGLHEITYENLAAWKSEFIGNPHGLMGDEI